MPLDVDRTLCDGVIRPLPAQSAASWGGGWTPSPRLRDLCGLFA